MKKNIALIGFMGTGKTAVAEALTKRLNMELIDMDQLIEARTGKVISDIFAEDGEPTFRAMESALAQELASRSGLIISAGGGIVLNPDNIKQLSQGGLVVCLKAKPETILERVKHDTARPLLAVEYKLGRITELLRARQDLYDAVPHSVITDGLTVDQVADRIAEMYRQLTY